MKIAISSDNHLDVNRQDPDENYDISTQTFIYQGFIK